MRWLALAALLGFGLAPTPGYAFHTVDTFSDPASEGGAAGVYYTGAPRFRSWDCAACHLGAPRTLLLDVASDPPGLFGDATYEPGMVYDLTVGLRGESKGLDAAANYNTIAVDIVDGNGEPVGGYFGFDENLMKATPAQDVLFARGQKNLEVASWTFKWQAPEAGTGYIDIYIAGVDGDGAGSVDLEQSDPLGDDVVTGVLRIAESGVPAPPLPTGNDEGSGCSTMGTQQAWGGFVLVGLLSFIRRRQRARGEEGTTDAT